MWKNSHIAEKKILGGKLRGFRETQGLTLVELSCRTGISVSSLSRIETGDRHVLLVEVACICAFLGNRTVGMAYFLEIMVLTSDSIRFGNYLKPRLGSDNPSCQNDLDTSDEKSFSVK